jgi:hypothetical protein
MPVVAERALNLRGQSLCQNVQIMGCTHMIAIAVEKSEGPT